LPGLGSDHKDVQPFVLQTADQFRPGPPPDTSSEAYAAALQEVSSYGLRESQVRTEDQTEAALFWGNDSGTYTPVGHLNHIASDLAAREGTGMEDSARLLAVLNITLADAGIACWDTKYHYNAWRPITAIREAGDDGSPTTEGQPDWQPLIVTPNHPEYASGHSVFAGAAEVVLTDFFGHISFDADSAGLPGATRHFESFAHMAEEDATSRIYAGVHFRYSTEAGLAMGRQVAEAVLSSFSDGCIA
jgi:hypothetical protein